LGEFPEKFTAAYQAGLRRKVGLSPPVTATSLIQDLLDAMAKNGADFTLPSPARRAAPTRPRRPRRNSLSPHLRRMGRRWRARLGAGAANAGRAQSGMHAVIPASSAQPSHRGGDRAAVNSDDYAPFEKLLAVLAKRIRTSRSTRPMPSRRCPSSA